MGTYGRWLQETLLYQVIEEHWAEFRKPADEQGGLPNVVLREVEKYQRCGRLEYGCLRLACQQCGHEELVAFSCKRRGFCPSCLGRRMTDTALGLVEQVLPGVQVRQWVCSLPFRLRALCGYLSRLCAGVVGAFAQELSRSLPAVRTSEELVTLTHPDANGAQANRTAGPTSHLTIAMRMPQGAVG